MEAIEQDIIYWLLKAYPEQRNAFSTQLLNCIVTKREYTDGGGVFVTVKPNDKSIPVSSYFLDGLTRTNGPELSSPELELGATVDVEFNEAGFVDYIEIMALANDYPKSQQLKSYVLSNRFC
ncbi:MAG: hypothetical protein MJK04_13505 [Psychrosphaera sp.]|nr:hypothetical protein [Psychrosphaera sp.]